MNLTQRYTIDKDKITYRVIDEEAVILNLDNGYYYSLNKVGTRIWELLVEKHDNLEQIIEMITNEYEVDKKEAKFDLINLVNKLQEKDLIMVSEK